MMLTALAQRQEQPTTPAQLPIVPAEAVGIVNGQVTILSEHENYPDHAEVDFGKRKESWE